MEVFDENFVFTIEMVILNRNENGATLWEIHNDFQTYFGINFDSIFGYGIWEVQLSQFLTNVMSNIRFETIGQGCVVYYMDIDAAIIKMSECMCEQMELVCNELDINLEKLIELRNSMLKPLQSTNNSHVESIKNINPKSTSTLIGPVQQDCHFYGHSLIGDDFFLEFAEIDLKMRKSTKKKVQQIGHCVSGQTLRKAVHSIRRVTHELRDKVIINLGSLDLLQGRELIDMMSDMFNLCSILTDENIFPIVTTLPPLANQMHNKILEIKRKSFNKFLRDHFDYIDIEDCFLSTHGRIMFDVYRPDSTYVTGSRNPLVIWNHVGRQRVKKILQRRIPYIYDEVY